jgi:hypothetical protein
MNIDDQSTAITPEQASMSNSNLRGNHMDIDDFIPAAN